MQRAVEVELIERSLVSMNARRPDTGAPARSPIARYTDPDRLARELAMMRRRPTAVAHIAELSAPGARLAREVFGVPVLLVRGDDGRVRGFLNICSHRGTRLVSGAGCAGRLTCPYHGWSYRLDGALAGVPHAWGFPDLDRGAAGLTPLPTAEAHGMIWCAPTTGPTPGGPPLDVDAWLGPLAEDVAGLGLADLVPSPTDARAWAANWKLLAEGGLEAYHFRVAHAETIRPLFPDNLFVADVFGEHIRSVVFKRSIADLRGAPRAPWRLREHANLLYSLFPTTVLLAQDEHVEWIRWAPAAPDRTVVHITPLLPPGGGEAAARHWAKQRALTLAVLAEDFQIAESVQAGFAARPGGAVIFGTFEHLLGRFNCLVEAGLEET